MMGCLDWVERKATSISRRVWNVMGAAAQLTQRSLLNSKCRNLGLGTSTAHIPPQGSGLACHDLVMIWVMWTQNVQHVRMRRDFLEVPVILF